MFELQSGILVAFKEFSLTYLHVVVFPLFISSKSFKSFPFCSNSLLACKEAESFSVKEPLPIFIVVAI